MKNNLKQRKHKKQESKICENKRQPYFFSKPKKTETENSVLERERRTEVARAGRVVKKKKSRRFLYQSKKHRN